MVFLKKQSKKNPADTIDYTKSPVSVPMTIMTVIVFWVGSTAVLWIFYRSILISSLVALPAAIVLERNYQESQIEKRKMQLRIQFKEMLRSMCVSLRSGSNLKTSIENTREDLLMMYDENSDIITELNYILACFENNIPFSESFNQFAKRSGLEDIENFASIFKTLEGKSSRISSVLRRTEKIISDKLSVELEIHTAVAAVRSEQSLMFLFPILLILLMDGMMGEMTSVLFHTLMGRIVVTVSLMIFATAYFIAQKMMKIDI